MWSESITSANNLVKNERREYPRKVIGEEAELFIPTLDMKLPCVVVNISASGAKITCNAIPPSGEEVVLIIKGGLSLRAVTTRYGEGELGLRFTVPEDN